ncbi:protein kinase domain-containing protein [Nitrospirillum sp. BR 11163]|uniref:protein kinase domain-containing protein n=1 Tax=Nitrospirillum sp. BR 11163 TaxID=3104323 RepID=UPI002AFFD9A2|nr:protein kinase [Nitrospirillum sp. BR 11163]MEA1676282.1 protein kinase [Nitrospirillum sp. BR 11163]
MLARTIGRYRIERTIGSGSYGTVVEATDRVLNRTVALKILRPGGPSRDLFKTHLREARALARLRHPNIVAIFDLKQEDDRIFLAMEHVDGETLAARLRRGPLPPEHALDMAWQLADALAAAHGHGVIHADIKPGNVILDRQSRPLLVDFGLARLSAADGTHGTLATTPGGEDGLKGTISYMAPELFMGAEANAQSDIFSFGALLYEMLSGRRAFGGGSDGAVMQRILNGGPDHLAQLRPGLPDGLYGLVNDMLAPSPAARPRSMEQVRDALGGITSRTPAIASPRGRPIQAGPLRRRRGPVVAVALSACVLVVALVAWNRGPIPLPAPNGLQAQLGEALDRLHHFDDKGAIDAAVSSFQKILAGDPKNAAATAGLSLALLRRYTEEQPVPIVLQQADAQAKLALSLDDQLALSHVAAAWVASYSKDKGTAYQQFRTALALEKDNALALEGLARLYQDDGQPDAAIATYQEGIKKHPDYRVFYDQLGAIYFNQADYARAERLFRQSVDLAPDSVYGYANLSAAQHMRGNTADAVLTIQKGLRIRPHWMLYNNLGTYLYFLGDYAQAAQAFERLTELDGNGRDFLPWGNLGDAYRWVPGKEEEARAAYRQALGRLDVLLKSAPDDPWHNVKQALYAAKLGQRDRALTALDVALAKPTPAILFDAAVTNETLGRRDEALALLAQAVKAGYAPQEIVQEPELAQLREDKRYPSLLEGVHHRE